eukprot:scaffold129404_cov21-Tisochrysis_lutea.AAC.1
MPTVHPEVGVELALRSVESINWEHAPTSMLFISRGLQWWPTAALYFKITIDEVGCREWFCLAIVCVRVRSCCQVQLDCSTGALAVKSSAHKQ